MQQAPVFTLGSLADSKHLLANPEGIPLVQTDRGGEITFHRPGQLVVYPLINLRQLTGRFDFRLLVDALENATIKTLATLGVSGHLVAGAPGVYVKGKKLLLLG